MGGQGLIHVLRRLYAVLMSQGSVTVPFEGWHETQRYYNGSY